MTLKLMKIGLFWFAVAIVSAVIWGLIMRHWLHFSDETIAWIFAVSWASAVGAEKMRWVEYGRLRDTGRLG